MEKSRLSKAYKIILAVTIAIMLIACMPISVFGTQSFAKVGSNNPNGYNLATDDLWNGGSNSFNKELVQELLTKLSGKKNATFGDVKNLFAANDPVTSTDPDKNTDATGTSQWHDEYGSKVIKAPTINANAGKIQPSLAADTYDGGLVVTLQGKQFRVASLTLDYNNDLVATLYSKDILDSGVFKTTPYQTNTDPEPSNMYGTSDIRKRLLSDSGEWSAFAAGDFATTFLVPPIFIDYQRSQSVANRPSKSLEFSYPNDAFGDIGGYAEGYDYYNNGGDNGADSEAQQLKRTKYFSWRGDYIWLPSVTEVANPEYCDSIWNLPKEQLSHKLGRGVYLGLRSGYYDSYGSAYIQIEEGEISHNNITSKEHIRPAIHLNLNAVMDSAVTDIWDEEKEEFNKDAVEQLLDSLKGTTGATLYDVKNLITASTDDEYGSIIVKSPQINQNAEQVTPGTEEQGLQIKLKGKIWRVTSLTIDDDGNVVATLLLKNPETIQNKTVFWNENSERPNTDPAPSNMYGTSEIRNKILLGSGGFQDTFIGSDENFAKNYMVKPKYIAYQRGQSLADRPSNSYDYSMPNDALDDIDSKYPFANGYNYYSKPNYTAWGNDYIWLPSITEIGSTEWTDNIWQMSIPHIGFTLGSNAWLRTGSWNSTLGAKYAYSMNKYGLSQQTTVSMNIGNSVRPAMHLNLTAVVEGPKPDDIWNEEKGEFDTVAVAKLFDMLGGKANTTLMDIADLIANSNTIEYESKIVKSPAINANAGKIQPGLELDTINGGLCITLKGKVWRVTSLTLDDNNNIVATLMLKNPDSTAVWNSHADQDNLHAEPSNMYGTSDIREKSLLGAGGFLDTYIGRDFAAKYMIQPKYIAYQRGQGLSTRPIKPYTYSLVNEALDNVIGFAEGYDYYNNGDAEKRTKYISWGEDYIWLPSLTEVGSDEWTDNIWQMPLSQISFTSTEFVWFRSGYEVDYSKVDRLSNEGQAFGHLSTVQDNYGLRPAMHLNLTAVAGEGANTDNTDWQHSQGGGKTEVPSGEGVQSNPLALTFNGKEWQFNIARLPKGLQLDISDAAIEAGFVDGYSNAAGHRNANGGAVFEVKIRLTPKIGYVFRDEFGEPTGERYRELTLYVRIDKLILDKPTFEGELTYNGEAQTAEFANYNENWMIMDGNTETNAKDYNATFNIKDEEKDNIEWAQGGGSGEILVPWSIGRAKYDLSGVLWSGSDYIYDTIGKTMSLQNLPQGLSVTSYGGDVTKIDAGEYTVRVDALRNADSNYFTPIENDPSTYDGEFEWTKPWEITKKVIEVKWDYRLHTNSAGEEFELPFVKDDPSFPISYEEVLKYLYQKADDSWNPTEDLASADDIIGGNTKSNYLISVTLDDSKSKNFDLKFIAGEPHPQRLSLGSDKLAVTVSLESDEFIYDGKAKDIKVSSTLLSGDFVLSYYLGDELLDSAPTNAGTYRVVIALSDDKAAIYYIEGDNEFEFTIAKAKLSLDGVAWGYDAANSFVYEWLDGAAVEHSVTLNGLDEYLAENAVYVNNTSNIVGVKTASVTFDIDADNYEFDDPAAAEALAKLVWEVKAKVFNKPLNNHTVIYDNTEHNLAEFGKLDDGWEDYFDVTYTKNGETLGGNTAKNAGLYTVKFTIKAEHRNGSDYYVVWAGNDKFPQTVKVIVEQREIVVEGWLDGKPPMPNIDGAEAQYYQIVYTYEGQVISLDDIEQYYGKTLKAEVRIADGMDANNVEIVAAEGAETYAEFIVFDSADEPYTVELPNSTNIILEYDRDRMRFEWVDFGGIAEDAQYLTVSLPDNGFGVGTHSIKVRIRSTQNAQWSDGTRNELELTVEIIKGKIEVNWDNGTPPSLIFGDETDELIEYVSYDSNGEIATIFSKGETYCTVASICAEFAANYGFWVDGEYLETVEKEFTVPSTVANPPTIAEPKLEFNGAEQTFELNGFDPEYMTVTGELTFTNAGKYSVTIGLKNDAVWANGTIGDIPLEFEITKKIIDKPTLGDNSLVYNGGEQSFLPNDYDELWISAVGDIFGTNAGDYSVTFTLKDTENTEWAEGGTEEVVIVWAITKLQLEATWDTSGETPILIDLHADLPSDAIVYKYYDTDGAEVAEADLEQGMQYTVKAVLAEEFAINYGFGTELSAEVETAFGTSIEVAKPTLQYNGGTVLIIEYDGAEHTFELVGFVDAQMSQSGDDLTQKNAGKYSITVSLKSGAKWDDGTTASVLLEFEITKKKIAVPTIGGSLTFNGGDQTFMPNGLDGAWVTAGGVLNGTNAGTYNATFTLTDPLNTEWAVGTVVGDTVTIEWTIGKLQIAKPTAGDVKRTYNGAEQGIAVDGADWLTASGDKGIDAGVYNAEFALKDTANTEWVGGGTDNVTFDWSIGKAQIGGSWDTSGDIPTLSGLPQGLPDDAIEYTYHDADGREVAEDKLEAGKEYTVKAELKNEFRENFGFGADTAGFELKSDEFEFKGISGDNDGGIADNLPLWQIIVTAVGLLLGLIFFGMSISNGAKTRRLRGEASEKGTNVSNAFAGLPLLGAALSGSETFLGMGNTAWTIIACVALAFGLCGLGTMLITGRQKNAAAQKLEKAERLEREEKLRLERQNEMKMMFMMMNGNRGNSSDGGPTVYTAATPVHDVKEIVTQVVAALMPSMQAQLPPTNANSSNQVLEKLVDQQMQVLDRQTKIIESFKNEFGREKGDEDEEGG